MIGEAYHLGLKRELLEGRIPQACCRQAFLLGLSVGHGKAAWLGVPQPFRDPAWLQERLGQSLPSGLRLEAATGRPTFGIGARQLAWRRLARSLAEHVRGIDASHCLRAYLKGLFIRCGYLQDPHSGYHLEIRLRGRNRVRLFRLVARSLRLPFRFYRRRGEVVGYLKGRRRLIGFLRTVEAFHRAMELEDLVATRNLLELVNRQVNFETANILRSVSAADRQIERLRKLLEKAEPGELSEALRQVAEARTRYPEDSLGKLGRRFSPPLSKSAVNHRLRRLDDLYRKLFPDAPEAGDPPEHP